MSRIRNTLGGALLVALAAAPGWACVDGRERPLTGPDEEQFRPDPNGPPMVFITHPQQGQDFLRKVWVEGSGVQVTYGGEFRDGDEFRLMAYLDYPDFAATRPFKVVQFPIQGPPSQAEFIRGQEDQFRDAVGVTLLLEIHDPDGFLISVDSVSTTIK